jgi:N-acetylglucosamine-6-phosphate deacetylase
MRRPSARDEPFAIVGRLVGATGRARQGAVVVSGGKIAALEIPPLPRRLPRQRREAAFVAPGLVDLQVNGAFGHEVGDDPAALIALALRLPATGVTAFLPALVSRTGVAYRRAFTAYDAATARGRRAAAGGGARILGLHLEGPLLAPGRAGAHDGAAIAAASADLMDRLADPARVRLVTLAPERAQALPLVARLVARGVTVSLGHTDASFETFTAAVEAGARLATHLYSAMSPLHHRAPGAVGAALTDDRVSALVIADGVHAHPAALRLALRAKGERRLALATDAVAAAGLPPGPSLLAGKAVRSDGTSVRLPDGTLAGSTLTLDRAVRNAVAMLAVAPAVALRMASAVPAAALGMTAIGQLIVGADADLVLLDDALEVEATLIAGTTVFDRGAAPSAATSQTPHPGPLPGRPGRG